MDSLAILCIVALVLAVIQAYRKDDKFDGRH